MDYEETLLLLDRVVGTYVVVYPAEEPEPGAEPAAFAGGGLWVAGRFKRDREGEQAAATVRRQMMLDVSKYRELRPELDLGEDTPLESYERQVALYAFEGMDDALGQTGFAGFSLWRHDFAESKWLDIPVRPDWLWMAPVARQRSSSYSRASRRRCAFLIAADPP